MPKLLSMKQVLAKKFMMLENLPPEIVESFGELATPVHAVIWGPSGNGKTNLVMKLIKVLLNYGRVLFVSLEEGHTKTLQKTLERQMTDLTPEQAINFQIADHELKLEKLKERLAKKRSARFVVIDSLQYLRINYEQYQQLKEAFPSKSFLFISHANGKEPLGSHARDITYDVGIKVRVEGYVAFPRSRFGGNKPFVIWDEGAQAYWGKDFKKITRAPPDKKPARKTKQSPATIEDNGTNQTENESEAQQGADTSSAERI